MAQPVTNYGIYIDEIFEVRLISPGIGGKIKVWVSPINGKKLMLMFEVPSGTRIGSTGRLIGVRHDSARPLYEEVARSCTPAVDPKDWQFDLVYSDRCKWWTESLPDPPTVSDPLPITIKVSGGSYWVARKTGRVIRIVSAKVVGTTLDTILKIEVINNHGRRSAAKKLQIRTLLAGYQQV